MKQALIYSAEDRLNIRIVTSVSHHARGLLPGNKNMGKLWKAAAVIFLSSASEWMEESNSLDT